MATLVQRKSSAKATTMVKVLPVGDKAQVGQNEALANVYTGRPALEGAKIQVVSPPSGIHDIVLPPGVITSPHSDKTMMRIPEAFSPRLSDTGTLGRMSDTGTIGRTSMGGLSPDKRRSTNAAAFLQTGHSEKSFLQAVKEHDLATVSKLIVKRQVQIDAYNHLNQTALMTLCDSSPFVVSSTARGTHYAMAELLINSGADINLADSYRWTPLHFACSNGAADIVSLLVKKGADISALTKTNHTPLHKACQSGNANIVKLLLGRGANKNALTLKGFTPLMYAARCDMHACCTRLVNEGADTMLRNESGDAALDLAIDKKTQQLLSQPQYLPPPRPAPVQVAEAAAAQLEAARQAQAAAEAKSAMNHASSKKAAKNRGERQSKGGSKTNL